MKVKRGSGVLILKMATSMFTTRPAVVDLAWLLVDENQEKTRENRLFIVTVLSEQSPLISRNSVCEILLRQVVQNKRREIRARKFCFFYDNQYTSTHSQS